MNKIKFKIGEFSKLNRVSIKTLRHYEEIGLLIPFATDEWTGYRYYDVSQFRKMNKIIYLKQLGMTLEEIRKMFDEGLETPDFETIKAKLSQCRQDQTLLQWRYDELRNLERQTLGGKEMESIFMKSLPARIVASHRRVIKDYDELFDLCPNIIGPEMQRLGCTCPEPQYCYTVDHSKTYQATDIDIEYCEAVGEWHKDSELLHFKEIPAAPTAVCINHLGAYDKFPESFSKLFSYVEKKGYKITDSPRFCYIDGIWNKDSENEWLTEIQIPVSTE